MFTQQSKITQCFAGYSQQRRGWESRQKGQQERALCLYPSPPGNTGHIPRKDTKGMHVNKNAADTN